ncbi:unnamed protein product [Paramecium sonneborni]|uniref:Uncharacterized protein n=1 Tax=Paramecium sonneborni TaxID=65129 RepID=A0A8S1RPF7_9CILI|nr:unnamed protein product [Paramecium sonneborni]
MDLVLKIVWAFKLYILFTYEQYRPIQLYQVVVILLQNFGLNKINGYSNRAQLITLKMFILQTQMNKMKMKQSLQIS